jgi:membrane protease YdiL (CAAX protease family)
METKYLLLSLITATAGFILWYALSSSLRLPKTFQIQYDVNTSYFNRILRRRLAGFLIYGLIPWLLIFHWKVIGEVSLSDLLISFEWNSQVTFWVLILIPVSVIYNWINAGKRYNQIEYPEIRVTIWTPWLMVVSAFFWIIYLAALEFLFRGLVLSSVYLNTNNIWAAILISTGLYAMIHYFKDNRIALFCIPYGLVMAYVTLDSGSLLPAILVHIVGGLVNEWVAIAKHPETKFQTYLY